MKNVLEIHEIVTQFRKPLMAPDSFRGGGLVGLPITCLKLASLLADVGYKLGDNKEYLSHYKVLKFDYTCEAWSKTFQFFAYFQMFCWG